MKVNLLKQILEIGDNEGWQVDIAKLTDDEVSITFAKETPKGQDFYFSIDAKKGDTLSDIHRKIIEYADDFDPDYEATLWSKDGHGIGGAPYRLKDIIIDMEDAEKQVREFAKAIEKIIY